MAWWVVDAVNCQVGWDGGVYKKIENPLQTRKQTLFCYSIALGKKRVTERRRTEEEEEKK